MKAQLERRKTLLLLPAGIALLAALSLQQITPASPGTCSSEIEHANYFDKLIEAELVSIALPEGVPASLNLELTTTSGSYELLLEHTSLRSAGCRLLIDNGNQLLEQPLPKARTYRGEIKFHPGSSVALSLLKSGLHGVIDFGIESERLFIQPVATFGVPESETLDHRITHVLYRGSIKSDSFTCGTSELDDKSKKTSGDEVEPDQQGAAGGLAGDPIYFDLIGFDADYEFFQLNGESVEDTVFDIESVINAVNLVYERDVNLRHLASTYVIRTNQDDPYTASTMPELACEFSGRWTFTEETNIICDLAQLFTGRELGTIVGYAWVGGRCRRHSASCSVHSRIDCSTVRSRFSLAFDLRVALSAHEIGHTWGAQHCGGPTCNIMCAQIGACAGASGENLRLSDFAQQMITGLMSESDCIELLPDPLELPFLDTFDSVDLSSEHWAYIRGASTSAAAHNEPSGFYSLLLDSAGTGPYDTNEIRSHLIPLGEYSSATISFWVQIRGVELGETLTIEYLASSGQWRDLVSLPNTGNNNYTFAYHSYYLPSDAFHSEFRIGLRANVTDSGDQWFIDNLQIVGEATEAPPNDECVDALALTMGAHTFDTFGATDSTAELPDDCDSASIQSDIWFSLDATCSGELVAHTCGSTDLDTFIVLYDGSTGCPIESTSTALACNDDFPCGNGNSLLQAEVVNGQPLLIRVGSPSGSRGNGVISLACTPTEEPCPADLDGDGEVAGADLALLLGFWMMPGGDLTGDGTTDGADLSIVLGSWGFCSP